jgi:hypothetical protein
MIVGAFSRHFKTKNAHVGSRVAPGAGDDPRTASAPRQHSSHATHREHSHFSPHPFPLITFLSLFPLAANELATA